MAKQQVTVEVNDRLWAQLQTWAAAHALSVGFVLGVAIDQFLSDPDNEPT